MLRARGHPASAVPYADCGMRAVQASYYLNCIGLNDFQYHAEVYLK